MEMKEKVGKMELNQLLARYRNVMSHQWIVFVFGGIYLLSQVIILVVLEHVGSIEVGVLQLTGFTSDDYSETFNRWSSSGSMVFYKAHFIVDGVHWVWYSILLTALLALAMNAKNIDANYNCLLLLPLVAGLCDAAENTIQLVFLSDPLFQTIVDPLPLISTLASIIKWLLAGVVVMVTVAISLTKTRGA